MKLARLFFALCFLSAHAQSMNAKKPLIIRGEGPFTLSICDRKPYLSCWYSRPNSYCEIPEGQAYKIIEKKKSKQIEIISGIAKEIASSTSDCYDKEPSDRSYLRTNYGRRGVRCKKVGGIMRCRVKIDDIFY